jgi:RHS repeat-associated protein
MKKIINFLWILFPVVLIGQTQNENYIKATTYKVATTVPIIAPKSSQASQNVTYFDGLGRPKQTIAVRQGGDKVDNNLLNWKSNWTLGTGSVGNFAGIGSPSENNRVNGINPFGQTSILWKCGSDADNDADGGWETPIAVDKNVAYHYAVWVKRTGSHNGYAYHGIQNIVNLDGTVNPNPYFWYGNLPLVDKWYLMIGMIYPASYSGSGSGISGVYDTAGNKIMNGTDFKWGASTVMTYFRSYLYYSTDVNTNQYFYAPNVQKIDGSEASISGLISGSQSPDIVKNIGYDAFGRQDKDYLPYAVDNTGIGNLRANALAETNSFYATTKYQGTSNPYSAKEFEASPLSRILQQSAPGNDWALQNNHTIKQDYEANALSDNVKLYTATATASTLLGLYEIDLVNAAGTSYYEEGQLYKTVTYDENTVLPLVETAGSTVEFKNKEGQIVLKRTYGIVGNGITNEKHDTYYVYDNFGNLTFVIPPQVDTSVSISLTILNNLCYQYKYDYRNRLVEKKLPGRQWEFIVYDKLDRVVATGPAASPFNDLTTVGWLVTKYDVLNRPVYTGWITSSPATNPGRKALQQAQNDPNLTILNETKLPSGSSTTIDNAPVSYSNTVAPTVLKMLTCNYYDSYENAYPGVPVPSSIEGQIPLNSSKVKGLTTCTLTRIPSQNGSLLVESNTIFYDAKARPIRNYHINFLGGQTITDSKLDPFSGQLQYNITTHKRTSADPELITKDIFTYSDQDRLLSHTQQINNGAVELIAENTYDEIGQLINKKVGKNTFDPVQKIDYTYNIRGWLTNINDTSSLTNSIDPKDLFAFKINYNASTSITNVDPLYNGNISETSWKTASESTPLERGYGYTYDNLNRLKTSIFKRNGNVNNAYDENLTYDKNGNILKLIRNGSDETTSREIDNLTYDYLNSSNKLLKVTDSAPALYKANGFIDNTGSIDDYTYDANGNMLTDENKGINTNIIYNHLDLPTKIIFPSGNITYLYNATGQKVQKVVTQLNPVNSITTTDYLGGYQYSNTVLKFFPTAEGYVEHNAGSYKYIFQYKDHLGNVRLSYDKDLVIQEENNYYPFGLRQEGYIVDVKNSTNDALKYKYNGKELQDELGLNMYDYGARNYDPAIGRWMNIDPLAEKSRRFNPYTYALNNPVFFIDPDGMEAKSPIFDSNNGAYLGSDSTGFMSGDILFMDADKYKELKKTSESGVVDHKDAVKNSISIADLPDTPEGMQLFHNAVDFTAKVTYKVFHGKNPTEGLLGGQISTSSEKNGLGINNPENLGTEFGQTNNVADATGDKPPVEKISINFDKRRFLNTAGNIGSLFEHEYHFHGVSNIRNINTPNAESVIYQKQVKTSIFKFTSGHYRQHLLD